MKGGCTKDLVLMVAEMIASGNHGASESMLKIRKWIIKNKNTGERSKTEEKCKKMN